MDILKLVKSNFPYIKELQQQFHRYPELGGSEKQTLQKIKSELEAMGVEYVDVEFGGIIGFIRGGKPGKSVLLRADIDALPLQEEPCNMKRNKQVVSQNPGIMHACGHDAHTAMLLGAAKILQENRKSISGNVILMFEQNEEGSDMETLGWLFLCRYVLKEKMPVSSAFALHMYNALESGKVAINDGKVMACGCSFKVKIMGKGGHASRPDCCTNPIDCFSTMQKTLRELPDKISSPFDPIAFAVCQVKAGNTFNIIPEELEFSGSFRTFDIGITKRLIAACGEVIEKCAKMYGCEVEYHIMQGTLPVINDSECAKLAYEAMIQAAGSEHVCVVEPWTGGDSFGDISLLWPGVFGLVGTKNEELGTGAEHHNPRFEIDPEAMIWGTTAMVSYVFSYLSSNVDTKCRQTVHSFEQLLSINGFKDFIIPVYEKLGYDLKELEEN